MQKPPPTTGMHHIALFVADLAACERFYTELMGMQVEWRPDENSVYLTSGSDNLALHRLDQAFDGPQRLDHLGFILGCAEDVDAWFAWLQAQGVPMKTKPRTHRDGARSFYCLDPAGSTVQLIYHPPLAGNLG
ncbi:VOC family protein [Thiohalomonas denitrificans]|uniref:VOC family protein n=1 Tax=Thiohalomonas denitrificans TaxID=415747 RepID=UPI0026EE1E74|nr:VOC family protein [Thiohalomonas denitrificans]